MTHNHLTAALAPVIVIAAAFVLACLVDLHRRGRSNHLPRWAWAAICCLVIPLGGVAYLVVGRDDR